MITFISIIITLVALLLYSGLVTLLVIFIFKIIQAIIDTIDDIRHYLTDMY